jgi:hypothetical protein
VRIWFKIDSNNALHIFLNVDCQYNRRLVLACGLVSIPSRRMFDRRLKTISTIDIKQRISTMGYLFVAPEGLVDLSITAIDSNLIKANGRVWHKSSYMKKGIVPCPGIDTDARWWDYSHTKEGWIFGYKLHLTCTTAIDELVVPLTAADVTTTANVPDTRMYVPLTSSSSSSSSAFSLPFVLYMIADPWYDAKKLYEYSKNTPRIDLICPVKGYKSTSKKRLKLMLL